MITTFVKEIIKRGLNPFICNKKGNFVCAFTLSLKLYRILVIQNLNQ